MPTRISSIYLRIFRSLFPGRRSPFAVCRPVGARLLGASEGHRNLGEVLRAADRAKELVQQILTFSRKAAEK